MIGWEGNFGGVKSMFKKVFSIFFVFLLVLVFVVGVQAANTEQLSVGVEPQNGFWEGWKIYDTDRLSNSYGSWKDGPSGWGPSEITLTNSYSVSHSFSGTLYVSQGAVEAAVGYQISGTYTYSTSYKVSPPEGEKWQIIFREVYKRHKVTQRKYVHLDGQDIWTNEYAYVYTKGFLTWDYDYKIIDYR